MTKKYKTRIMISSLVILCMMLVGILLWDKLPETIETHFGSDNTANGWSSKAFTVFGMPLIMLGLHLLATFVIFNDPKKQNIGEKMMGFVMWVVPIISVGTMAFLYMNALGMEINIGLAVNIMLGIVFIIIGNYLPKCKQNYTTGIKLPWTLSSTENWNRTHRLAGWTYILCGIVFLINTFFTWEGAMVIVLVLLMLPMVYSFVLFKKGV